MATVGDLRAALRGVPDDTPLLVAPGPEPGGGPAPADRVVVAAGHHRHTWRDHAELGVEVVLTCATEQPTTPLSGTLAA